MDLKLLKMLCKDSKQHHVIFHELYSVSSLLCIAQNVRFEIPYKVLYFETPFLIIFKYYAWVSCVQVLNFCLQLRPRGFIAGNLLLVRVVLCRSTEKSYTTYSLTKRVVFRIVLFGGFPFSSSEFSALKTFAKKRRC